MNAITYWVIRYVPNVARGEFENVGVVCGGSSGDWAVSFDWHYIQNRTPKDFREWALWFERQIGQRETFVQDHEFTKAWVEGIRVRQANSVQLAPALPIAAGSAREAADLLYPHLVEHDLPSRRSRRTRRQLRIEVRDALQFEANLIEGADFFERPEVRIGQLRSDVDFVQIGTGSPVIRNVWGFDVAGIDDLDRDVQAWNYSITRLRDDGGRMASGGTMLDIPAAAPVAAIIDLPHADPTGRRKEIFDSALESWEHEGVSVMTIDEFQRGASQLAMA